MRCSVIVNLEAMNHPRKGAHTLRTLRTRDDHDLFRITLPRYDSKQITDILLLVQPGQTLRPQQPLVLLTYAPSPSTQPNQEQLSSPQQLELGTHVAGVVQTVGSAFREGQGGWRLGEEVKGWQLQLCQVRACQHIIQKQSINDSLIRQEGAPSCPNCLKPIWIHLHPDVLTITSQDLLEHNPCLSFQDLFQLEWAIVANQHFTPTTAIAKASDKDIYYPLLAKAVYLIGEGQKPVLHNPIMKVQKLLCRHEKILERRCQYCLQVLQLQQLGQFNRYLFQLGKTGSMGLARGTALAQQQQDYISTLVAKRKAILVLDLDNTILHSCEMNELSLSSLLALKEYFVMPKMEQSAEGKVKQDFIVVKMRPYFEEFLYTINKLFQLYVYTKGTRIYAEEICRWVRHQWAGNPSPYDLPTWSSTPSSHFLKESECFAPHRLISRNEDTSLDTKSLQNILPSRTEYHLILDDRRDVWANSPSWFYTRDYFYFIKRNKQGQDLADYLSPPQTPLGVKLTECYTRMRQDYPERQDYQLELAEREDFFLLYTCHALKKIHHYFFHHLQKQQEETKRTDEKKEEYEKGCAEKKEEKGGLKKEKGGLKKEEGGLKEEEKESGEQKDDKMNEKKGHPVSIAGVMQKIKLFMAKKKLRFFVAPGDQGISTTRRALKMGAVVLKPTSSDVPDFIIRGNSFVKYVKQLNSQQLTQKEQKIESELPNQPIPEEIFLNPGSKFQTLQKKPSEMDPVAKKEPSKAIDYQSEFRLFQEFIEKGTPIIAETWILASYEFSYKFKWQDFKLAEPLRQDLDHGEFNHVLSKQAEKIRVEIRQQMDQG